MSEIAQLNVSYEEILHTIAMDAHANLSGTESVPPFSPSQIAPRQTQCGFSTRAAALGRQTTASPGAPA